MAIGLIGLGNMGIGVAINLLRYCKDTRQDLVVFDIDPERGAKVEDLGGLRGESIAALARSCTVVFTSLPGPTEVTAVATGPDGLLANLSADGVWFELSTNSTEAWNRIQDLAGPRQLLIDAPVSGGADGANRGELSLFAGAESDVLEPYHRVLGSFCARIFAMGRPGAGYMTKLCQLHLNYLGAIGVCEVHNLASICKVDLNVLGEALNASCSASYVVREYLPKILDGSYDPSFSLGLAAKDTHLIASMVRSLDAHAPYARQSAEIYERACALLGKDAAHLSIAKSLSSEIPGRAETPARPETVTS
jgi:3-hydroxyisobutyrate dehydrogenase-like beta-hydroxyacid dehydrogenase